MNLPASRRDFFKTSALLAAGAAVAPLLHTPFALAADKPPRNGTPKFKFSLAAYSYRDLLTKKKDSPGPELSLEDFVRDCAAFQLDGTELTSYYFPADASPEYLRKLKLLAFQLGLDISGTAVGNDLCHPEGAERTKQIALVKKWVDNAEILGAPVIRVFSGNAKKDQTTEEAHKLAVAGLEECCDYAGQHGVVLALENHGGLTTTVDGLLALVRDVKSPWFGVNLDSGNFHGEALYEDLAKIAPYAYNAQIKVVVQKLKGKKEPSDFKLLAKILRDAGYRGYVVLEYEESEDPRKSCPKYLDEVRAAFA